MLSEDAGYWCPVQEQSPWADVPETLGAPITGALWVALLKFSSGDWNVEASECESLLERNLVERKDDMIVLTPSGRIALGLPV